MPLEFYLLCLFAMGVFGGWILRIDYMQYKADQYREERAEERRQAYEEQIIKQANRNNLISTWVAESKGGFKR